jgi:hypothetical protein
MTMPPSYFCRRSISAAANPAAPPPTITILFGSSRLPRGLVSGRARFSRTTILPSRSSTSHVSTGLKAGARNASPVRRSKHA